MTFNAKNLNYGMFAIMVYTLTALTKVTDPKEPAFLRRLRDEYGDRNPARHERPLARPKKHRISDDDDDDDEPTYVDGISQNVVSKANYDALMNPKRLEKEEERSSSTSPNQRNLQIEKHATIGNHHLDPEVPPSQLGANIGGNLKKRLPKIVGDDGKLAHGMSNGNPPVVDSGSISKSRKKEKKAKKIKLSFDEDDGK
ncbi:hypothetical protein MMC29_003257 [Sticta canariensis]|nr:hypothetical protein [Sticta canariensis]